MKKESIIGTVLMLVGFLVIMPIGFAFPDTPSIMTLGVYSFIGGGILLFVANGKTKQNFGSKDIDFVECKKVFDTYADPFIKEKLMYNIYESDKLCICNVANVGYYVFPYDYSVNGQFEYPVGVSFSAEIIEEIILDNDKWYRYIQTAGKEYVQNYSVILSPDVKSVMERIKNERDKEGPGANIDLEWEEKINMPKQVESTCNDKKLFYEAEQPKKD